MKRRVSSRAVKRALIDILVPGVIGVAVLVVVDVIRGESASW